MSIVRAERVDFQIAPGYFLEFYRLPSGEKRIGKTSAAVVCGFSKNFLSRMKTCTPGHLSTLQSIGFTGDTIPVTIARDGSRGASVSETLSLSDFNALLMFAAFKADKKEAKALMMAMAGVAIETASRILDLPGSIDSSRSGFVYLLKRKGSFIYKIGMTSRSVDVRVQELEAAVGQEICVIWSHYASDARSLESALHNCFADRRMKGEWFDFSDCDNDFVVRSKVVAHCPQNS